MDSTGSAGYLALRVYTRAQHKILKIALAPEDQRIVVKDNMTLETSESIAEAQMQESGVEVERGLRDTERGTGWMEVVSIWSSSEAEEEVGMHCLTQSFFFFFFLFCQGPDRRKTQIKEIACLQSAALSKDRFASGKPGSVKPEVGRL